MKNWIKDAVGLGTLLWLFGYVASLILFFTPLVNNMGWIISVIFALITIVITWLWFRARGLPLLYFVKVGIVWTVIAIILDYLFIVQLFQATYYETDVFVYYALTFLIPAGVGLYLNWSREKPAVKEG